MQRICTCQQYFSKYWWSSISSTSFASSVKSEFSMIHAYPRLRYHAQLWFAHRNASLLHHHSSLLSRSLGHPSSLRNLLSMLKQHHLTACSYHLLFPAILPSIYFVLLCEFAVSDLTPNSLSSTVFPACCLCQLELPASSLHFGWNSVGCVSSSSVQLASATMFHAIAGF